MMYADVYSYVLTTENHSIDLKVIGPSKIARIAEVYASECCGVDRPIEHKQGHLQMNLLVVVIM